MESSNNSAQLDVKLQIAFPKSSEDHRLQLVEINGSIFAILHSPLESLGPILLHCEEWSLVILAPIKSKTNIAISAVNVICLSEIESEEGDVNIHASNLLVKFADSIKASGEICEKGDQGKIQFEDDPGAFLQHYRLFESIVDNIHKRSSDSFSEAEQKFILSLCTLANKIEGNPENLDLNKVLSIWNILHLKPQ